MFPLHRALQNLSGDSEGTEEKLEDSPEEQTYRLSVSMEYYAVNNNFLKQIFFLQESD